MTRRRRHEIIFMEGGELTVKGGGKYFEQKRPEQGKMLNSGGSFHGCRGVGAVYMGVSSISLLLGGRIICYSDLGGGGWIGR